MIDCCRVNEIIVMPDGCLKLSSPNNIRELIEPPYCEAHSLTITFNVKKFTCHDSRYLHAENRGLMTFDLIPYYSVACIVQTVFEAVKKELFLDPFPFTGQIAQGHFYLPLSISEKGVSRIGCEESKGFIRSSFFDFSSNSLHLFLNRGADPFCISHIISNAIFQERPMLAAPIAMGFREAPAYLPIGGGACPIEKDSIMEDDSLLFGLSAEV